MSLDPSAWDWPEEEIKRIGYRVVDIVAEHLSQLPERPVFRVYPRERAQALESQPLPTDGATPDHILEGFRRDVEPYPFGNGHPRFFGWVNSPPTVMGVFAEALAAAMNPSCAGGNHAAVFIERQVIRWFKELVSFPQEGFGLMVSGGSMAALTALNVARHAKCGFDVRAKGLQHPGSRLTFYKATECHGCHQKALELMGIGADFIRTVPHDSAYRMQPSALDRLLEQDRKDGFTPVAVIATAGTVNTGAIDPLLEIADICRSRNVWLHVDGAYGAPAILSGAYRNELEGISAADSIALDPHKWLCVPVEAGVVLIRDAELQRAAFSLVPPYLRTDGSLDGVGGPPWFSEYGFQQTRAFRALKVWMSMRHLGVEGYREVIERELKLAAALAERLRGDPNFLVCEPQGLTIVCFRYAPIHLRDQTEALNSLNTSILETVQLQGRAFVSSTVMNDVFWLRACVLNPRSTRDDIEQLIAAVNDVARSSMTELAE
jgi:glutamate/tyrosine decarboxylase-like PLP-dependent enzyme